MISVYSASETLFSNNGLKILKPLKAKIRKEDNGDYYIDLKDTIDNIDYYQTGMIIRTNTPWGYQCFRLSNPKIENNKISIKGHHLYFDTQKYIIEDSYVVDKNCNDALDHLNNACDEITPFEFISDVPTVASYRCVRKTLEEAISEVINRWGGHLYRDNFNVAIRTKIGMDRGVVLSYAKNIKKLSINEVWDNVVTKIMPVGKNGLLLPEIYLTLEEDLYDIPYKKVVEFEQDDVLESDYTVDNMLNEEEYNNALLEDLRYKANAYLEQNKYPQVNYSVDAYIKDVSDVGDTIYVKHPKCKVDLLTNVIAIEYDCILEKYTKIEFGNFKNKLKDLISTVKSTVEDITKKNEEKTIAKLEKELQEATSQIWGTLGDSFLIYDGDKLLVLDSLPKEEAKNVIMINSAGIGFSSTGINGIFNSAWTIDGTLNMQNVNVINLIADMIKGGTLKLGSNLNEAGIIEIYDEANVLIGEINKTGITVHATNGEKVKLNAIDGFAGYDVNDNKIYWADGDEFHMRKSVVEEEITIASKARILGITTDTNDGIGVVAMT